MRSTRPSCPCTGGINPLPLLLEFKTQPSEGYAKVAGTVRTLQTSSSSERNKMITSSKSTDAWRQHHFVLRIEGVSQFLAEISKAKHVEDARYIVAYLWPEDSSGMYSAYKSTQYDSYHCKCRDLVRRERVILDT